MCVQNHKFVDKFDEKIYVPLGNHGWATWNSSKDDGRWEEERMWACSTGLSTKIDPSAAFGDAWYAT